MLTKHLNTTHNKATEQENGTFACTQCEKQFSSKWTYNDHIRDKHNRLKDCEFFKKGDCRFPDKYVGTNMKSTLKTL